MSKVIKISVELAEKIKKLNLGSFNKTIEVIYNEHIHHNDVLDIKSELKQIKNLLKNKKPDEVVVDDPWPEDVPKNKEPEKIKEDNRKTKGKSKYIYPELTPEENKTNLARMLNVNHITQEIYNEQIKLLDTFK